MTPCSQPSDSRFTFNPIPEVYDAVMGPLYFEPYAEEMARCVASWHPASVLETACGTGIVTAQLRKCLDEKTRLVATDLNADMLEYARKKLPGMDITWQEANAMQLPFPDKTFDAVVCPVRRHVFYG
jgi:ubiquinone/menaquinone biosynthesis C-methylase UbiE